MITDISQGSIISPLLTNIYLNELDKYINILCSNVNKGKKSKISQKYNNLRAKFN
jgi:retron-type reverse transcriptase